MGVLQASYEENECMEAHRSLPAPPGAPRRALAPPGASRRLPAPSLLLLVLRIRFMRRASFEDARVNLPIGRWSSAQQMERNPLEPELRLSTPVLSRADPNT